MRTELRAPKEPILEDRTHMNRTQLTFSSLDYEYLAPTEEVRRWPWYVVGIGVTFAVLAVLVTLVA